VGDVAGQGEEGGAGVPVAPLADSLLAAEAARRTVAPAGEGSQQRLLLANLLGGPQAQTRRSRRPKVALLPMCP
jgi:hypothetical protein